MRDCAAEGKGFLASKIKDFTAHEVIDAVVEIVRLAAVEIDDLELAVQTVGIFVIAVDKDGCKGLFVKLVCKLFKSVVLSKEIQLLARHIAELTEEIEQLKSEKVRLLTAMERTDDKDISTVNDSLNQIDSALAELDKREEKYTAELNEALQQYTEYKEQSKGFNAGKFGKCRFDIRTDKERNALDQISNSYGEHFSRSTFFSGVRDADMKLDDDINMRAIREYAYHQHRQTQQQQRNRTTHEQER